VLYSDDLKEMISFFSEHKNYSDSLRKLRIAKQAYIERVRSSDECKNAMEYASEVYSEKKEEEVINQLKEKQYLYRTKELEKIGYIPRETYIDNIDDLISFVDGVYLSERNKSNINNEYDKDIVQKCLKTAYGTIDEALFNVLEHENDYKKLEKLKSLLIDLMKCDGCSNELERYCFQIDKKVGVLKEKERILEAEKKKKKVILIAAIIFSLIIGILLKNGLSTLKESRYKADNLTIKVVSKENDTYNETLADGYRGSGYFYTFGFMITNKGSVDIQSIQGNLDIMSSGGTNLATFTVNWSESIKAGSSSTIYSQINVYKGDNARYIWNNSLSGLKMTFRITSITYADGTRKQYTETKNKPIN
jgi:hypothetical protein